MRTRTTAKLTLACLGLLISQPGAAAEPDGWQFEVTPYFFAAGMNGTVGIRGVTADVHASFSDIWAGLDAGFMGLFTAQKGPWSFGLEGVYMKLGGGKSNAVTGPGGVVSVGGQLDVTTSLFVAQGSVSYREVDEKTKVDLVGAVRYTVLNTDADVKVQFTPGIAFPGGESSASGSEGWVDFVVGARAIYPIVDNVSLVGYADVGAGGSKLTYQVIAGANWEFSRIFTAKAGYRYISWDYDKAGTVWDMSASGPYVGLGIRF